MLISPGNPIFERFNLPAGLITPVGMARVIALARKEESAITAKVLLIIIF
jgi:hypothetical protein